MANNEFIGRRVSVGLAIEDASIPGVKAAQQWFAHLSTDFQRKVTTQQNESALARIEKVNDSVVVAQWAEGKIDGKVQDISIGYFLSNMLGLPTTALHPSETLVKDHTFALSQNNVPSTLTITRKDPLTSRRHGLGTLSSLELDVVTGDFVKLSASLMATFGADTTDTVAFVNENEFTHKHATVKLAANVAGLTGATAVAGLKSLKLKMTRKVTPYYAFGAVDVNAFNTGSWEAQGEFTLRYDATTYETLRYSNTQQAMSIDLKNTDITIGTSANPELVFTMPKVRLNDFGMSNSLDDIVEQTISFYAELDQTAGYLLQAVLTNTLMAGYVHA